MSVYTTPGFVAQEPNHAADRVLESYHALCRELQRRLTAVQRAHAAGDTVALEAFASNALSIQLALGEMQRYIAGDQAFACYTDALQVSAEVRDLLTR